MNKEKGNTVIGLIAVAAVAILVGIWIGAKTDIAEMDMDAGVVLQQQVDKGVAKVKKTLDNFKMKEELSETEDSTNKTE